MTINLYTRNIQIDFMRGIAILLVLFHHFNLSYSLSQSALNKIFPSQFISNFLNNGNYGVTLFFVISGFLITSTTIERYKTLGGIDPIGFYIFRFARIIPCLLLAVVLISFFNYCGLSIFRNHNSTSFFIGIFSVLTFWHNVLMEKAGWFNYCLNTFWSLSVEEMFYFSFPIACLLFKKTRFIVFFWLAFIIIAPFYRHHYSDDEIISVYGYFSCFDAIAVGCCTAILATQIKLSARTNTMLKLIATALFLVVYFYSGIMNNIAFGFTLIAISAGMLLITAQNSGNSLMRGIGWFGKNSYELYLFHIILLALMKSICKPQVFNDYTKLLWLGLFIFLSALIADAIEKYYSRPLNSKIRRFLLDFRRSKLTTEKRFEITPS